ncbi:MAG: hypothetical protein ACE5E3_00645 [Mariprofundus sp.]
MNLVFILVANDEGLIMAEVGESPGEDFAPYSASIMETADKMTLTGNLGNLICSALVLQGGRMLIMHEANVGGQYIYLSILCSKVPNGVQSLIRSIVTCVSQSLLGNSDSEHSGE